jgi:hypothetical protein
MAWWQVEEGEREKAHGGREGILAAEALKDGSMDVNRHGLVSMSVIEVVADLAGHLLPNLADSA